MSTTSIVSRIANQYDSLRYLRDRRLALLGSANVLDTMSVSLIAPLLPLYADRLGASALLIGVMFAAETAAQATLSTPFGYLADRFGNRIFIVVGTVVSALSVAALGLVTSPLVFIVLRALDGAAGAMRYPATAAYIGDEYPENERGRAMGAYSTLGWVGLAIGPAVGGLLATSVGLAAPFLVLGSATAIAGLVLALRLPAQSADIAVDEDECEKQSFRTLLAQRSAVLTPSVVALAASSLLAGLASGAFYPLFPLLLERQTEVGPSYTGLVWSAFGVAMFLFTPVGGTVADRIGRKPSLVGGWALWTVVYAGLVFLGSPLFPPSLLFLGGFASAMAGPAKGTLNYETAPDEFRATIVGFYGTVNSAGASLGPILGGVLAGWFDVGTAIFGLAILSLVNAGIVAVGVSEPNEGNGTSSS